MHVFMFLLTKKALFQNTHVLERNLKLILGRQNPSAFCVLIIITTCPQHGHSKLSGNLLRGRRGASCLHEAPQLWETSPTVLHGAGKCRWCHFFNEAYFPFFLPEMGTPLGVQIPWGSELLFPGQDKYVHHRKISIYHCNGYIPLQKPLETA